MRNYENYTPEINYGEEAISSEKQNPQHDTSQQERRQLRRRRVNKTSNIENERKTQDRKKIVKEEKQTFISRFVSWLRSPSARIIYGIFLGCLAIYFTVSFISYFSTCIADQSKISSAAVGSAKNIANPGGEGGARLSELLINEGFGVGSLIIIIWIGALALKALVGRPRFRTLDFTIKCLVALITLSLIIGLLTFNLHTQINWGGYHGTYVNETIINFIGNLGAILLCIFMFAVFVSICMRDVVKWFILKKKERAERRRIAAEKKAAILAKEEEIRNMRQQEAIDDLRAGETSVLNEVDNMDDPSSKATVDFGNDGLYVYAETGENNNNGLSKTEDENLRNTADSIEKNDNGDNIDQNVKADNEDNSENRASDQNSTDKSEEIDNSTSLDENSEKDSDSSEKMVVNVGTIGQSDSRRFKSDVEHFEEQNYKFPPFNLLKEGTEHVNIDAEEQMENKEKIRSTLLNFGIPIISIEATVGPTVTLYEIVPDSGVKIAKIRNLVDDIALSLKATGVRIIAPIPGKGTVGIEVANKKQQTVSMRTIIKSNKYQESKFNLPIALGSTISNSVYIADLAKMPHLLVAGATGQGKSVGLNAIIASLLYCKAPHEIKFVMIDPKQVEFSLYNKLKNHYMAAIPGEEDEPVITDTPKVEATLNSLVIEMENRYSLLKNAHTRNIEEYNAKIRECRLNPAEGHKFLPYIVVIVDEFGDLVMMSKSVETPIARLAQKARAVGMHVIIATQRPSTNVITGIIKANFPARISFKVSSGVDSKTILDTPGAQQLIGRGDMLIFNSSEMVRVQCAFIDTPEVEKICEYVNRQPYPQGIYLLPEPITENGAMDGREISNSGEKDALFVEVARAVLSSGRASTSSVQRTFEIGYNRAGRIMDQLENVGVVGPSQGGKPRAVLVGPSELEDILQNLGLV